MGGNLMPKPSTYSELFPGRFLKADLLKGQKVNLTIKDADLEGLEGEDGKKQMKAILSFEERPLQLVCCKTNGISIRAMFGSNLADWIGKRVTLYEDSWNSEPCIRVYGSPDIPKDMKITIQLPRRRPMERVLHAVKSGKVAAPANPDLDPRISAPFGILGWDSAKQAEYLTENAALGQGGMAKDLNLLIEERDRESEAVPA